MNHPTAVLVLYPDEVQATIAHSPWLVANADWICLSVDAFDQCLALKLPSAELPSWIRAQSTFSFDRYSSRAAAFAQLDESAVAARRSQGFSDKSHWNHYHHFTMVTPLDAIGQVTIAGASHLSKYQRVVVPQRSNPGDYHFPGALPSVLLSHRLRQAGVRVESLHLAVHKLKCAYAIDLYERIPDFGSPDVVMRWTDGDDPVLLSPAGLFYAPDKQKLADLEDSITSHDRKWSLAPPFWNVLPDGSGWGRRVSTVDAFAALQPGLRNSVSDMVEHMAQCTWGTYADILGHDIAQLDAFSHQIGRMRQRFLFQVLVFFGLAQLQMYRPAKAVIVSNLDGGINGPLYSIAEEFGIPCYVLPHSQVVTVHTEGTGTVLAEYWQPSQSTSYDGRPNPTRHVPSTTCEPMCRVPAVMPRVTCVYNGIHRGAHTTTSLDFLKLVIDSVTGLCISHGAVLEHRLKPGDQTPVLAYAALLNLDHTACQAAQRRPLTELFDATDLVVSVDEPSSAHWTALERGCAVVLIRDREYLYSAVIDEHVLRSYSLDEGLKLIDRLLADPTALRDYAASQSRALANLRQSRLSVA